MNKKKALADFKKFQIGQQLTQEQVMLQQLFGSGQRAIMPDEDSDCLPIVNGALMPNRFNEENLEPNSEDLFGLRKKFRGTASLFGIG